MGNPIDAVFGNNKPPDPPDFAALERQKAEANRVDQYTPYGSLEWSQPDPNNPNYWRQDVNFTPEQQAIFEAQQTMQQGQADAGVRAVEQAGNIFSSPFEVPGQAPTYQGPQGAMPEYQGPEGDMPEYGAHRQQVMDAMLSRVGTDIGRDRETKSAELIARGIPAGSEAYQREMEMLDRKQTDARQQAEIAAEQMAGMGYNSALSGRRLQGNESLADFTTGMAGRQQGVSEGLNQFNTGMRSHNQSVQDAVLNRNQPINEMNAWQTGSQISMPNFSGYNPGPDYSNAGMQNTQYDLAGYNADTAQNNSMMSGLFGLGAAAIPLLSDRRLKKNIKRIGTSLMGFPVYTFNYIWGGDKQTGVMAQDVIKVMPEAVINVGDYMAVDYGMIK